ncbi:MAG: exodeoxyribonuclease VII small subunit [Planctomycetota bacterium]|nr:exodeoxyribonuclease VII small subunit [Planctomycetota bacterium]
MSAGKAKGPKFEQAISELEAIIERIESGDCGLEECITQYEKGVKLLGHCQGVLQAVQQRIAELTTDAEGKLRVKDGEAAPGGPGASGEDAAESDGEGEVDAALEDETSSPDNE